MAALRVLIVLSMVGLGTAGVASGQQNVPVPRSGAYLGLLTSVPGLTNTESMVARESQFSRTFAIDSRYFSWADGFPTSAQSWDVAGGRIPMITWWWPQQYTDINDGSQDSVIRARAEAIKAFASPIFLRPAAEMNGDWFDWDGTNNDQDTAGFISAWRHIHDIFDAEGVHNVSWVWAPNSESSPGGWDTSSWNNWRNYYPGDAYVDWIGIDGYNWGTLPQGDGWLPFGTIMNPVYSDYASRKPIMIAETGSTESGGDKAQWITDTGTWIQTHPAIKALIYFDRTYDPGPDWGLDTSTASLSAFAKLAANPYFGVLAGKADTSSGSGRNTRVVAAAVLAAKVQRQGHGVRVKVRLVARERVTATVAGEVSLGHVELKLRPQTKRLGADKRATLTLRLMKPRDDNRVMRALTHENVNATVRVTFTGALGTKASKRVVVRLKN